MVNRHEIEIVEIEREVNENRGQAHSGVLKGVIERVRSLTDAEGAFIGVCDAWGVVCRASAGKAPDVGSKLPSEPTLTRRCIESGQVVTLDEDREEDFQGGPAPPPWRWRSVVAVPVQGQGPVLGVVEVLSSRAAAFSPQHVAALERITQILVPVFQAEEPEPPKTRGGRARIWIAVSGAALFLLSLWLWFDFFHQPRNVPPATNNPAASSANPAALSNPSGSTTTPTAEEAQSPEISDHSKAEAPPRAASSASVPIVPPGAKPSAAVPASKPSPEVPRTTGRTTTAATSPPPAKANRPLPRQR